MQLQNIHDCKTINKKTKPKQKDKPKTNKRKKEKKKPHAETSKMTTGWVQCYELSHRVCLSIPPSPPPTEIIFSRDFDFHFRENPRFHDEFQVLLTLNFLV